MGRRTDLSLVDGVLRADLIREYRRRLDCEFLGIDPDYRPPILRRVRRVMVRWVRYYLGGRLWTLRDRLGRLIAPWLHGPWDCEDV